METDFKMSKLTRHANTIALHRIDIASPCTASWDKMTGDNRVRHCGDCNKNVFNLSAMPEAEAAALLASNDSGQLCVRFYRRADGTLMTSDCGASPRAAARQAWRKLPGVAGLAFMALSAGACSAADVVPVESAPVQMATMGAPPAVVPVPQPKMGKPMPRPAPAPVDTPAPKRD
jgi:hypothetical protein